MAGVVILAACSSSTTTTSTTSPTTTTQVPDSVGGPASTGTTTVTDGSVVAGRSTAAAAGVPRQFEVVQGDTKQVVNIDRMITTRGACHLRSAADAHALPDPTCTPGVIAARVNQANIKQTICVPGYTTGVRPSASATDRVKQLNYVAYAQTQNPLDENDHLVPLELGGANDPRNLWNQPPAPGQTSRTNAKDQVENTLHSLVCTGRLKLADAQRLIAIDWATALNGR